MKKLTQQYFIIPGESEFAKNRREYQRNQAQLKEAFAEFAEKIGLESRDVRIEMYTLMIVPTENDLIKFGKALYQNPHTFPFYLAHMDYGLYRDWCAYLRKKRLEPYPEMGFRHLCSYKGRDACFQEFTLNGDHYGCIMAPEGFTISGEMSPISSVNYYFALLGYMNRGEAGNGNRYCCPRHPFFRGHK